MKRGEWWSTPPKRLTAHGEAPIGSEHPNARLDETTVYEMRIAHFDHGWSHSELAERFDVGVSTAQGAVSGVGWKHVKMERRWQKEVERRRALDAQRKQKGA